MVESFESKPSAIFNSTFKKFVELGRNRELYHTEAHFLYCFYIQVAIRQDTHNIYCTSNYTMENTGLSVRRFKGAKELLQSMGLISKPVFDAKYKKYFFTVKVDTQSHTSKKDTNKLVTKKEQNVQGEGGTERTYNAPTLNNSPTSTFINKSMCSPKTENTGSRLIKKKRIRPSLINDPEPKKNPLSKPMFLSDTVKECFAYWNKHTELVNHKINLDSPSKTMMLCKTLINSFLAGTLLDKAIIPDNFKNKDLNYKQTVDDFKDHVDYLVYCINKRDVLPRKTDPKISIITFLQGNSRFTIPAAILMYCFTKPIKAFVKKNEVQQSVIKFDHPRSPENNTAEFLNNNPDIDKDTWFSAFWSDKEMTSRALSDKVFMEYKSIYSKAFGVFDNTPENEKILRDTMYLCALKNATGNNGKQIFPYDYGHKNIFSILINENVWAKDKAGIRFLTTDFFKGEIKNFINYTKTNRPNAVKTFEKNVHVKKAANSENYSDWSH